MDDLGPPDDLELGDDAGRSIDPIVTPEQKQDASAPKDAAVAQPKDAAPSEFDAGAQDAGNAPSDDAGGALEDASMADAGPCETDASAGDASAGDAGSEPEVPKYAEVYALIATSCVGCHGAGKTLDLSTPEVAYAGMVGVTARYTACVATGAVRVVPGDPDGSLLMAKLEGKQSCGKQMPPAALLAAEKLEVFRAWIAAGANDQ